MDEGLRLSPMATARLLLRPLCEGDAEIMTALLQDPVIAHWTKRLPWPYTIDDARYFIARQIEDERSGVAFNWGIIEAASGEFAGVIGLHGIERTAGRAELGYWMGEPYRGRGYMTEAARRVLSWAFETAGFERVQASHFPGNDASAVVMQRIGMTFEGILRGYILKDGEYLDAHLYAVLRGDAAWESTIAQDMRNE